MAESGYRKFARDIGILVLTDIAVAVKSLLVLPVIAKLLGASAYGIWVQAIVTITLLAMFCDLNLSAALARFLAAEKDRGKIREGFLTVTLFAIGGGAFLTLLIILFRYQIAGMLFHDVGSAQLVFIIAITIPFYELNAVAVAFFRALREIKTYSWFVIGRELLLIAILIPLVLGGFGISGALGAFLLSYFIVDAVMFALILSRTGLSIPRFADLRPYLKFSLPTIPNSLSGWLVSSSDRYVISFMLGTASVGIYSASYGLGSVISYFSAPLSFILIPTLSKLYDERNFNEVKVHMSYSLKYFLMFAIPGVCGLSVLAVPVLRILTTAEFVTVASIIVPLIAVGYLCFGLYVVFSQVFIMLKRMNIIGIQWMVVAGTNLVLNIIFVRAIGITGAAVATFAVYLMALVWVAVLARRYLRFPIEWQFILKSLGASLVMSLVIWRLNPSGIPMTLLTVAAGAIVYFTVLFLLQGFKKQEIEFFKSVLRRS